MNLKKNVLASLFVLCTVSIIALPESLSSLNQFQENNAQKYILDNGMTVVLKNVPSSSLVSFTAVVKTGSATEGEFLGSGISHFVEHMLFKGTNKRKVGQIAKEIESLGGNINGFTTYDYTGYTITLPKDELDKGLEILADAIMNSQFDPEELEKEREVILSEIRLYQDEPGQRLSRLFFANSYVRHPYRHPVIGYEPLLKSLTRDDLLKYYKRMHIPNNIVLAVVGGMDQETFFSKIKEEFREFQTRPYILRNLPSEPKQLAPRRIEDEYSTELTRMLLGFTGVSISDKDVFALDALMLILGQGESSRLYRQVYKSKGLVYSISSANYTMMDGGRLTIGCVLAKGKTNAVIEAIYLEIDKIKIGEIDAQELEKAKRQVLSSYIFSRQTTNGVARDLALSEAVIGDFDFSKKYVEAIKKVSKEDIQNAAIKYLNKETLTIAVLNPIAPAVKTSKPAERKASKIKRIILDNGLTVLLKEDSTYPIVSIKAIFSGGVRKETEDNNGISNLTSRMLLRGTESRSSEVIAETVESLGGAIDVFSGKNSFGISLNILSQDLDAGVELLADIVNNSVFSQEELDKEKELALAQIKAQDDSIFKVASKSLKKTLFKIHPYRFDSSGTEESLKRVNRQGAVEFYDNSLVPGNMVLAVFGDIKSENLLKLIKEKFGQLAPKDITPISLSESFPKESKEVTISIDKEQSVIMLGFPGVKLTSPERYSLEALDYILTSMGGRLYQKIREELGQAYTLGGGSLPGIEGGFYYIYVSTTLENLDKVKEVILREIKDLQTNYVDDQELSTAKIYLSGSQKVNLETNSALALKSGLDELYGLGFDNYKSYQGKLNSVTKKNIRRAAKLYLNTDIMAIVIVKPRTSAIKMSE